MPIKQILACVLTTITLPAVLAAGSRDLVVVRPGGPSPSEEARIQVSRLVEEIGVRAGWEAGTVSAHYFNDSQEALAHIESDRPGFLLTTPGFFLAHRVEFGLLPVNQILIDGSDTHTYFVVAQKGSIDSIGGLAGGTLAGSPLAEPDFVERIILDRKLEFGTDVTAEYQRALSALRSLSKGEVSAVLLDAIEYAGLENLPFAGDLETVLSSDPVPSTGIFALADTADTADIDLLDQVTREFCVSGEGAAICETYGISGFQTPAEGVFDELIAQYAGEQATP